MKGEIAILYMCYKEARGSLLLHVSKSETANFGIFHKEAFKSLSLHAATAGPAISGIHLKEALCSPLLHGYMVRLQLSVYIIRKPCAHHCYMHERRDCKFRNRL